MTLKRISMHLDDGDMALLFELATRETAQTGSPVSAAHIVRRVVRQYLIEQGVRDPTWTEGYAMSGNVRPAPATRRPAKRRRGQGR